MPTQVFEDTIDLVVGLLQSELPESVRASGYPYPALEHTGREESRTFLCLVLENEYLKLSVLPELGGRLFSILDKRTGIDVLPTSSAPSSKSGGPRGVTLPWGVELYTQGGERLNALGTTAYALEPSSDADSPGAIWVGRAVEGSGLSFHLKISLEPDRAQFMLEAKILNRTSQELSYNGAFAFHVNGGSAWRTGGGLTYFSAERKAGFWVDGHDSTFDGTHLDGDFILARFEAAQRIAPRQLDTFSLTVVPFSGLNSVAAASSECAAELYEGVLRIQTSRTRLAHKLLVLTHDGQTLEAPVELYPERLCEISVDDLPSAATQFVLLTNSKEEILRISGGQRPELAPLPRRIRAFNPMSYRGLDVEQLRRLSFSVHERHIAFTHLARKALFEKEYGKAESYLEQALLYNADDHLAWWTKAMASRLREGPLESRPELLNAHFLAPFEPALRAEAFLAQDQEMGKEPNPLLASFAEEPELFVEVAALLADLGLNDQATRWIDEALRHVDLVMLRYLQAFCFLRASRMHVEAAQCVADAARIGFTPPLPWREVEWEAIETLVDRFPEDELLNKYFRLRGG